MFFWQCRNAVSCLKVIRKRFSTADHSFFDLSTTMIPNYQSFEEVLTDSLIHVDKSLLIKDIIKERTVLLTRPRRWGKSLNMKMIESFFQPDLSPEGMIVEDKVKKEKFSKMLIGREFMPFNPITGEHKETAIIDLQGTVPVVSLTFPGSVENSEFGIREAFKTRLRGIIKKHHYLLTSNAVTGTYAKDIFNKFLIYNRNSEITYQNIVKTLEYILIALNQHHNKKPILLVDEYDKTLLYLREKNPDLYKYGLQIYNQFFSVIKDKSQLLKLTIFTGVTRISKENLSSINNIRHDSVWSTKYGEHFGFSNEELDAVIDKAHSITPKKFDKEDAKKKITNLYYGYKINNKMMFNPFAVMHCIYAIISGIESPYQNYWANSGSLDILIDALNKVPTSTNIDDLFKTGEVMFIPKDGTEVDKISVDEQAFLTTLLDAGYLTEANKDNHYKIPNHEVRCEFYEKLNPIWINRVKDDYFKSIISKDEFENPETFLQIFKNRVLSFIKGVAEPEAHFQNLIYLSLIKTNMEVEQKNLTEMVSKANLVIYPLNDLKKLEDTVYIIEIKFKIYKSRKDVFNEGLVKIFERYYAENEMNKNENLKIVVLRVVTFGYRKSLKWQMSIVELKFTRENLKKAIELYRPKFEGSKKWKNAFEDIVGFSFSNKII